MTNTRSCNQLTWGAPYAKSGPMQTKLCDLGKTLKGSKASILLHGLAVPWREVQKNLKAHALAATRLVGGLLAGCIQAGGDSSVAE